MKKFLSLLLCAMLALCALTPAMAETAAEEPAAVAIPMPMLFADYQACLAENAKELFGESVLTWEVVETESGVAQVLYVDGNYSGVMALVEGEYVTNVMVVESGELDAEGELISFFMVMTSFAASGVLPAASEGAMNTALVEIMNDFTAMIGGEEWDNLFFDRPCIYNVSSEDSVTYEFLFVLNLTEEEAAAE